MNKEKIIIYEYLTISVLISLFIKKTFKRNNHKIFYIEPSSPLDLLGLSFIKNRLKIEKFIFKLKDIKDTRGELVQERIRRLDLFDFEKQTIDSESFKSFFESLEFNPRRLRSFTKQSLINGSQFEKKTIHRFILLLEAISFVFQNRTSKNILFIIDKRPWFYIYEEWGLKYNIQVKQKFIPSLDLSFQNFPFIYFLSKYLSNFFTKDSYIERSNNNLFLEGRGDINLSNDGYHSDYFWYLNSSFPSRKIVTEVKNDFEADYLETSNVSSCCLKFNLKRNLPLGFNSLKLSYFNEEHKRLYLSMMRYQTLTNYWKAVFLKYDIKTYLTWNKYNETHIAKSAAIDDIGGISAIWQLAFDGFKVINARYDVDVNYSFSKLSVDTDIAGGSKAKYQIISGYPKRYAEQLLSEQAKKIRHKILSAGANQIIFVIDENSKDDDRWHTGHSLQVENYQKPLEFMLKNKDYGLIFKPKNSRNLKNRLDEPTNQLLSDAIKTGKCILLDDLGIRDFTTSAPPMLAAMASDFCIHGHFGTAAFEAAFIGKPTILIDREGSPDHIFYDQFNEKNIFPNWEKALQATEDYFNYEESRIKVGNWSRFIAEFDPFDDNLAAKRIGDHLTDVHKGFDIGLNKHESLERAAELYARKWGSDKIIRSSH